MTLGLKSGRDQGAWHSLSEMWPASDADQIREILLKARGVGILNQLDRASTPFPKKRKPVVVFTPTSSTRKLQQHVYSEHPTRVNETEEPDPIIAAVPILVRGFPTVGATDETLPQGEMTVTLVIDSAGKVRSAAPLGTVSWKNVDLTSAFSEWKLAPAFKGHRAVASSMVEIFSLQRQEFQERQAQPL